MNRKLLFSLLLGFCCMGVWAQPQQVIASSGASFKQSGGSVSYTIGELLTVTLEAPGQVLTQGFQQTRLTKSGGTGVGNFPDLNMSVYPNPVNDLLMIRVETWQDLHYSLHDVTGVLMEQGLITGEVTEIDFRSLSPAIYILRVFDHNQPVQIVQIVKH